MVNFGVTWRVLFLVLVAQFLLLVRRHSLRAEKVKLKPWHLWKIVEHFLPSQSTG